MVKASNNQQISLLGFIVSNFKTVKFYRLKFLVAAKIVKKENVLLVKKKLLLPCTRGNEIY